MSSKSGPPILGFLGVLAAIAIAGPGAAVNLLQLLQGFTIGFAIGAFLFPPELEEDELEEFDLPTVDEGTVIPVGFGKFRTPGVIVHFDPTQKRVIKNGDVDKEFFGPMQVIVCMSDNEVDIWGQRLDTDQHVSAGVLGDFTHEKPDSIITKPAVRVVESNGDPWAIILYFIAKESWNLHSQVVAADGLGEIADILENYSKLWGAADEDAGTPLGMDYYFKSWPQVSWGGIGLDFADSSDPKHGFANPKWAPSADGTLASPEQFQWPDDQPAFNGCLTMASPVWYWGQNVSSAPNLQFEVNGAYLDDIGRAYYLLLTHPFWGMGLDPTKINFQTFAGVPGSAFHFSNEALKFNGKLGTQKSVRAHLEDMNFHTNSIVRADHLGRLELCPLRSIDKHSFSSDDYETWITVEGAPDTGGSYTPGFPVLFDVYDEDPDVEFDVSNQMWDTTFNHFTAGFTDVENEFAKTTIILKNEAGHDIVGTWIPKKVQFPLFGDSASVVTRLQMLARQGSRPNAVCKAVLSKRFHRMRPGDGIRVWSKEQDLQGVIFRAMRITDSELGDNRIEVEGVLDMLSLYSDLKFQYSSDVPDQDVEPATPDDPDDPIGIKAHADHWRSNVAYPDGMQRAEDPAGNLLPNPTAFDLWSVVGTPAVVPGQEGPFKNLDAFDVADDDIVASEEIYEEVPAGSVTTDFYSAWFVIQYNYAQTNENTVIRIEHPGGGANPLAEASIEWELGGVPHPEPIVTLQSVVGQYGDAQISRVTADNTTPGRTGWFVAEVVFRADSTLSLPIRATLGPGGVNPTAQGTVRVWKAGVYKGITAFPEMKTPVYVGQGKKVHTAFRYAAEEGTLNPFAGAQLPAAVKGNVISSNWGQKLALFTPIAKGEDRYVLKESDGGQPIYLVHMGYPDQNLEDESWFGEKDDVAWETDTRVLIVSGKPGQKVEVLDPHPTTEILRFKKIERLAQTKINLLTAPEDFKDPAWTVGSEAVAPTDLPTVGPPPFTWTFDRISTSGTATGPGTYTADAGVFNDNGAENEASIYLQGGNCDHFTLALEDVTAAKEHRVSFRREGPTFVVDGALGTTGAVAKLVQLSNRIFRVKLQYLTGAEGGGSPTVAGNTRRIKLYVQDPSDASFPNKDVNVGGAMVADEFDHAYVKINEAGATSIYKLTQVMRSCNKEQAYTWNAGTEAWIVDLKDHELPLGLSYQQWPNRALGDDYDEALPEQGHFRVRAYAQSITDLGTGEPGTEVEQPEDEGLTRTFDHINSAFLAKDNYRLPDSGPMGACISARMGDFEDPLWFDLDIDKGSSQLLVAPNDFLDAAWIKDPGLTGTVGTFGFNPFTATKNSTELVDDITSPEGLYQDIPDAVLTNGTDYTFWAPIKRGSAPKSAVYFLQIPEVADSPFAKVIIDWEAPGGPAIDPVSQTQETATFAFEYIGRGWWVVVCTLQYDTGASTPPTHIRCRYFAAQGFTTGTLEIWHPFMGATSAATHLPRKGEWLAQFAPLLPYGGIGDAVNNATGVGGLSNWPRLPSDVVQAAYPALYPPTRGTYRLRVMAHEDDLLLTELASHTIALSEGDLFMPTFKITLPATVKDFPSGATEYATGQTTFLIDKEVDAANGVYTIPREAVRVGPWPQSFADITELIALP